MLKMVLDTNTLVSAFFWEGNESDLLKKIEEGKAYLFISPEILKEVEEVIKRPKFENVALLANQTPGKIIQKIISVSHMVFGPRLNINVCRDPKDNIFVECAVNAKADYIVSGDKDLLSLKKHNNIKIVATSEILKLL